MLGIGNGWKVSKSTFIFLTPEALNNPTALSTSHFETTNAL